MAEHSGDRLSALLDGELRASEAGAVRAHVAACGDCARELEEVREARRFVRSLPAVEPPASAFVEIPGLGDGSAPHLARSRRQNVVVAGRRERRRRSSVAMSTSIVAGMLLLVVSSSRIDPAALEPEVDGALAWHASTVSALLGSTGQHLTPDESVPPTTAPQRSLDHLPAPYDAPSRLEGYDLVEAYRSPGGLHLLYQRGDYGLSVFELPGRVDWDALPSDGTRMTLAGHDAWRWDAAPANGRIVVLEDDGMVVMVVGDEPGPVVMNVAASLPSARSLPLGTRMKRAVAKALELFSPTP